MKVETPGEVSEGAARFVRRWVRPVTKWFFRPSLDGVEHLPSEGPYLLVSNHNAGLGIAEIASFASLWNEEFGRERRLAGFAHPIGFRVWPLTRVHVHLGSIPSTYDAAYETLDAEVPILVFPGGDYETMRPVWQANRVDFGGRVGFLRIARRAGVPIVPMGIRGSHYTAPMLWRSRLLAYLLIVPRVAGQKRWVLSVLGIFGAIGIALLPLPIWLRVVLAVVWLSSPFALFPWIPSTISFRIGEPIEPEELFGAELEERALEDALTLVEGRIAALVRS